MPLGPTSASRAPFATEKETLAKRSSAPKDLEREDAVISDMVSGNQCSVISNQYSVSGTQLAVLHKQKRG
jgi:hypothetical protein